METIFALCSPPGKAGVAVIRVSGPEAWDATRRLCGTLPELRQMAVRVLQDVLVARVERFQRDFWE